ncbi:unnamed protein product [Musa banksii]
MDGSEEASGWAARSSASGAPGAAYPASSSSLGLVRHRRRTLVREEDEFEVEEEVEAAQEQVSRILSSADKGGGGDADVSLREWLDRPGRAVDLLECLHIFRQIAEAVGSAHGQGVVVANVRPSCFVMSPLNSVSFIESASCSTSGSVSASSDDDDAAGGSGPGPPERNRSFYGPSSSTRLKDRREEDGADEKKTFPLKRILLMEWSWYTSPEEADGVGRGTFAADVYRLGVLLFELFCTFDSLEEKLTTMADLRHRVLPPQLLLKWPKEASFCLWLLHPQPDTRPKISEVLRSEFLNRPTSKLEERVAAIKLTEEIEDEELLLEFLLHLKQRKQEVADRLRDSICFISADVQEVQDQRSILLQNSYPELDTGGRSATSTLDHPVADVDSSCFASRKRFRSEFNNGVGEEELGHLMAEAPRSGTGLQIQVSIASKSSRLMKNFKKLEAAYFSTRRRGSRSTRRPESKHLQGTSSGTGSAVRTERSSVDDVVLQEGRGGGRRNEWINPFLEGLCKYLSFSRLKVKADLKQGDLLNSMNLVCSMDFDRDNEFFATAGVNKKIKVFECDMILNEDRGIHYPVVEMSNRSKLSCICWNGYIKSQIASSDFEGVVQVWDVTRSQNLAEMREHEKRVWSVDFSLADPTRLASGGDDGTVKLWSINKAGSVGTIRTKANVCSIQFQPESAHLLAVGSADHKVYCFDLRNLRMPCCTLAGHTKTVSYVKYLDSSHVVSASTDNSLKLWNLPASTSGVHEAPLQTFAGHTNNKNFVGLSVSDGYIATGSETNEVFIYHKAFPMPVLSYKFSTTDPISGQENDDASQFVSCVCWRGQSSTLLAANSSGNIKFLEMIRIRIDKRESDVSCTRFNASRISFCALKGKDKEGSSHRPQRRRIEIAGMCSLEKRGRVYVLSLTGDNEHRLNADLIAALRSALAKVRAEYAAAPNGSALVTAAEGRFFSNGFDLAWANAAGSPSASLQRLSSLVALFKPVVADLMSLPMPTISAVNGHAAAAGFMLAISHDYTVMRGDRGFLYMSELDIGLSFPPYFMSLMRAKIADPRTLTDVTLRAAKITGAEAKARGIVDSVHAGADEALQAAMRMGEELAARNWDGGVYASIRMAAFPDLCRAVGLPAEDAEQKDKTIAAKL